MGLRGNGASSLEVNVSSLGQHRRSSLPQKRSNAQTTHARKNRLRLVEQRRAQSSHYPRLGRAVGVVYGLAYSRHTEPETLPGLPTERRVQAPPTAGENPVLNYRDNRQAFVIVV